MSDPTKSLRSSQVEARRRMRPHPARDEIIEAMRIYGRPISPTQLQRILPHLSLGSAAYHVRTLVQVGIVELAAEGRVRGAVQHFYRLVPSVLPELFDPVPGS